MIKKRKKGKGEDVVSCAYFKNREDRNRALKKVREKRSSKYLEDNGSGSRKWAKNNKKKVVIQNATKYLVNKKDFIKPIFCEVCGCKEELVIHHIKYTINPKDWAFLCRFCHYWVHKGEVIL